MWLHRSLMSVPHRCRCSHVSRCGIYVHPSPVVQDALNALMDVMADYDKATGSISTLSFESQHNDGIFTSLTTNDNVASP